MVEFDDLDSDDGDYLATVIDLKSLQIKCNPAPAPATVFDLQDDVVEPTDYTLPPIRKKVVFKGLNVYNKKVSARRKEKRPTFVLGAQECSPPLKRVKYLPLSDESEPVAEVPTVNKTIVETRNSRLAGEAETSDDDEVLIKKKKRHHVADVREQLVSESPPQEKLYKPSELTIPDQFRRGKTVVTVMRLEDNPKHKLPCGYCHSGYPGEVAPLHSKVLRHMRTAHSEDPSVMQVISLYTIEHDPMSTAEESQEAREKRLRVETLVKHTSTYMYNKRRLECNSGMVMPERLPRREEDVNISDFAFCRGCNGLYKKGKNMKQHIMGYCSQRDPDDVEANRLKLWKSKKNTLLDVPTTVNEKVRDLVRVMRRDMITKHVQRDELILYVAHLYLDRVSQPSEESTDHIRQRMRLLARAVLKSGLDSLKELIIPKHFLLLCETAKNHFTPSAQIKLGIYLRNSMELLQNVAIQDEKKELEKTMVSSIHLFSSEWRHRVGHLALMHTEHNKFNTVDILPISRDVLVIRDELDRQVKWCIEQYKTGKAIPRRVKMALACKATVFNKRRGMEFVKSTKQEIREAIASQADKPLHQVI